MSLPPLQSAYTHDSRHVYFNISIPSNNDQRITLPDYSVTRTRNIVDKASDYYLSIIRFTLPSFYVPILVVPVASTGLGGTAISEYVVTFDYNGQSASTDVVFPFGEPSTPQDPDPGTDGQLYVYSYSEVAYYITVAMETAINALKMLGLPAEAEPPVLTFDPETDLFTLYASKSWFDPTNPDGHASVVEFFMNDKLYSLFGSFWSTRLNSDLDFAPDNKDVKINVVNKLNNETYLGNDMDTVYLAMEQDYNTTFNWNPFKKIVMVTNLIPVDSEYVRGAGDSTLKILTDFEPGNDTRDTRSVYQYFPRAEYRLADLTSDAPVVNVDVQVYWQDIDENLIPVYIPWNSEITIKMAFLHKSTRQEDHPREQDERKLKDEK